MTDQPLSTPTAPTDDVQRPEYPDEYVEWLWNKLDVSIGADTQADYEEFAQQLERQFRDSGFFGLLPSRLLELHADHKVKRGEGLLAAPSSSIELDVKSWESFLGKTYRRNVLENRGWPGEPERGWVVPETWHSQIGDVVRTIVVVRFLDGMDRVAEMVSRLAAESGLATKVGRLAKVEGYYATHIDVAFPVRVPIVLDVQTIPTSVEIQVTTELQANIRELAHGHYEERRMGTSADPSSWQWNYESPEFSSNYLGHVLHYLEGMIMQLREERDERPLD